ncbi:MAG: transcription antitermination factor NusB [Thermodesulfobacteriota bacterium]|nr:transcription antitermination factor NusB [Thermodesulfobacteriota bacterium]
MGGRRKSRELALQVLYQIDISCENGRSALEIFWESFKVPRKSREFSERLVVGVSDHKEDIDNIIGRYSKNWSLKRMPKVDRNILRLSIYELFFCLDIPAKVTINEAIELGKKFGTEKSGSFINGILDSVSADIYKIGYRSRESD